MRQDLVNQLKAKTEELRGIIKNIATEPILWVIAYDLIFTPKDKSLSEATKLKSPYRQYLYLYGLLVSTKQIKSNDCDKNVWNRIKVILEEIADKYTKMYYPTKEDYENGLSEHWKNVREVAMHAFLHYFNTFELIFEEQLVEKIKKWFLPFDSEINQKLGYGVQGLVDIYEYIHSYLDKYLHELEGLKDEEKKTRERFLKRCEKENKSLEETQELAKQDPDAQKSIELIEKIQGCFQIKTDDLYSRFDKKLVDGFIENFSVFRDERDIFYYTNSNIGISHPLCRISDSSLFCVVPKALLVAIYNFIYKTVEESSCRDKFYKLRGSISETDVVNGLKRIFKEEATYHKSLYETTNSNFEHDVIVNYKGNLLIIEVKSGKISEPFRDPDRAFIRITKEFKSEEGIQKAYDQALRLKQRILKEEKVCLYDDKGNLRLELQKESLKDIFILCVTADSWGPLVIDLSLLLDKPTAEPYPWCCNLIDLENLVNGLLYKKMDADYFIEYIKQRTGSLHERLIASDELEIAGFYLNYKSLKSIEEQGMDKFVFGPEMSNIFDKIYFEEHGIEYNLEIDEKPVFLDVKEEIRKMFIEQERIKKMKVGRNKRCPCGSGIKFKKCCGR